MTTTYLDIPLEEVPLFLEQGVAAAPVNCTATVSYDEDGDWWVVEIRLDAYRVGGLNAKNDLSLELERGGEIYGMILDRLESPGRWHDQIDDAVVAALDEEREWA